jgi:sugar phosphate isomerase/epimerase
MDIGLQLWTVRHEAQRDFEQSLRRVAEVGYRAVEFAGYGGWPADELKDLLASLNLRPVSTHVSYERLTRQLESELEYAKALGLSYLVCPGLPRELHTQPRRVLSDFERIGQECREAGLVFGYHNHAFELETVFDDGRNLLETLLDDSNPQLVAAEFDVYWLQYGGIDPLTYIHRYGPRTPLLHIKDMTQVGAERRDTEIGSGTMAIPAILEAARAERVQWLFVEQEDFDDSPWPRIAKSFSYLREHVLGEASA